MNVCERCIGEGSLAGFIEEMASETSCDFCRRRTRRKPIAVDVDLLAEHMQEGIEVEYEDAANSVGYESAEGGYLLPTMDTDDLLESLGVGFDNDDLRQAIVERLPDCPWVHKNPYSLTTAEALRYSWREFSDLVKHQNRYLFFPQRSRSRSSEPDLIQPEKMLAKLGGYLVSHQMVIRLVPGTRMFRVRIHAPGNRPENSITELGPPPNELAHFSNRMSPAGVSMFYAALDTETALAETYVRCDGNPAEATIATFESTRQLFVLDLTRRPNVPSIFDSDDANLRRPELEFLINFIADFVKPVVKDGREHVAYVPSQVVTEYVRFRLPKRARVKAVDGIIYPSSRRKRGISCVLFVSHDDLRDGALVRKKPPLRLCADLTRYIAVDTTPPQADSGAEDGSDGF